MNYKVLLFYKYVYFADPEKFMNDHLKFCRNFDIKGRIFISTEGINGTVSGKEKNIEKYKANLKSYREFSEIIFKEDEAASHAFGKMFVRVKKEIVNSSFGDVSLSKGGKRLMPEDLLNFYEQGKEFVIVDARNWYESRIGRFKDAIAPPMKTFRDWPFYVKELKKVYKDKTVVTYCTGGIRCEKASAYMIEQGFSDVYQLDGGIVSFIKKYPDTVWEGGVFVFDERRVVEPNSKNELKYISECFFCKKPTSYYINCHNLDCDQILVSCHECKVENDYCCSDECRRSENRRSKYYG